MSADLGEGNFGRRNIACYMRVSGGGIWGDVIVIVSDNTSQRSAVGRLRTGPSSEDIKPAVCPVSEGALSSYHGQRVGETTVFPLQIYHFFCIIRQVCV